MVKTPSTLCLVLVTAVVLGTISVLFIPTAAKRGHELVGSNLADVLERCDHVTYLYQSPSSTRTYHPGSVVSDGTYWAEVGSDKHYYVDVTVKNANVTEADALGYDQPPKELLASLQNISLAKMWTRIVVLRDRPYSRVPITSQTLEESIAWNFTGTLQNRHPEGLVEYYTGILVESWHFIDGVCVGYSRSRSDFGQ